MKLTNIYFPVLKHGFVGLLDYMGSDKDIEQAARLSYNKFGEDRDISQTERLIRYLTRHRHTSVIEQAELKFHIRLPIYVMRQLVRHRASHLNESSQRYTAPIDLVDITEEYRLQSRYNKQSSYGVVSNSSYYTEKETELCNQAKDFYDECVEKGIAREQARKILPLSTYTEIVWKIDLHNLLHFINLRSKENAQKEIRDYAIIIGGIVKQLFPITFKAWYDYIFTAVTFTQAELILLNDIFRCEVGGTLKEKAQTLEFQPWFLNKGKDLGLTDSEMKEFFVKLQTEQYEKFNLDISRENIDGNTVIQKD
jgi:thymidylate synthase (FAD)